MVAEYLNISLPEVYDMDLYDFLFIRREAFIHRLSQTEAGNEYLDLAWRLQLKKPDRQKLREKIQKN